MGVAPNRSMKPGFILGIFLVFALFACARHAPPSRPAPSPSRVLALPETEKVRIPVYEDARGKTFHRVQASKPETLAQAEEMEKKMEAMGFVDAFMVRVEAPR